jgi:hypothetical protein
MRGTRAAINITPLDQTIEGPSRNRSWEKKEPGEAGNRIQNNVNPILESAISLQWSLKRGPIWSPIDASK